MIGQTISHYKILEKLGEGGMGVVYKAEDTKLDRMVALKFLPSHLAASEQDKARFIQEAKAASAISHPNICTIYSIEENDGQLFIAMDFVDGQTLRQKKDSVSFKQAIDIGIQIADGLAAAHEKGIVHRDIKPENIMIRKDGITQIMDFGLAKLRASGSKITRLTKEGSTVGTAGYMSPEQVQGQDTDHRSDIFSYGVLLYELLTGQLPFKGVHDTALAYEIVNVDAAPVSSIKPEVDPALDAIVFECLEKDVNERAQSIKQIAVDLKKYKRESSRQRASRVTATRPAYSSSSAVSQPSQGAKSSGARILPWLIAGVAILCALILGILHFTRQMVPLPTIRTSVLPDMNTVVVGLGSLALSPDGSMLAYVAADSSNGTNLWLRPMKSFTANPLQGTKGALFPFWSPDNKFIGFFARGMLKKIEANGGLVTTICKAEVPSGGSWNEQGTIIFTSSRQAGIFRVSAQGGTPVQFASGDTTSEDVAYSAPCFLPDGKHFLFSTNTKLMVVTSQREKSGMFVGSLDSDERRSLMGISSNAIAANGYLLYARDYTLVAQKFDSDKLELSGDPAVIAEQIQYSDRYTSGVFSVSQNGMLVYQSRASELLGMLVVYNRKGDVLQTIGKTASYDDPVFSPDGSRLAFSLYEGSGSRGDVWITELSRGTISRFTFSAEEEDDPVWSPDGMNIVFSQVGDIVMKPSSGTGEMQILYSSKNDKVPTDISNDGKYLIYGDFGGRTGRDIWVLPMTGERKPIPVAVSEFNEVGGQFSPEGKWMAYASNETGRHEIYVRSFPSSSGKWQISSQGGVLPQWGAGGRELFYLDLNEQLMAVKIQSLEASIQAGEPSLLFRTKLGYASGPGHRYDVSADGQKFIINDEQEGGFRTEPLNLVNNWYSQLDDK